MLLNYSKLSELSYSMVVLSYSMVALYNIGIMKVWGFWPKIITPKPA